MKKLLGATVIVLLAILAVLVVFLARKKEEAMDQSTAESALHYDGETRLSNIKQLTFAGENAEGYFSSDASMLCFQSTRDTFQCDQIYTMNADGSDVRLISTGKGRATCSFIAPDNSQIIYASTQHIDSTCPPRPKMGKRYVWPLYSYDIFACDLDGSNLHQLTDNETYYDAEAVYSAQGDKIVFTSDRDGDLELYSMKPDGSDVTRLTFTTGYDGGAWYTFDGQQIVFRGIHLEDSAAIAEYRALLLDKRQVAPEGTQLYIMNADGSNMRQLTDDGFSNFAPYPHPNGKYIIYCSNRGGKDRRTFALFLYHLDDGSIEQVTFSGEFDGFPMFSYDGTKLLFASNRNNAKPRETNLFIADWKP